MQPDVALATELIESLAPGGASVPIRTPLLDDEARWFRMAIDRRIVIFGECPPECFRARKWGVIGRDHFETPAGKPRHLFSKPVGLVAWLNREYVPHIGAYAYAIEESGYDARASSFSLYRKFRRDLISKRIGQSYETDVEFYTADGSIHLQIEAKASERQTVALASAIETHGSLTALPTRAAKEIEYVLDLSPQFLWIVGPGTLDPPRFVYEVRVDGSRNASFSPLPALPPPPGDAT
jgi:hypothetical protein